MVQPRKVRKALYEAPLHIRRNNISSHLSDELYSRYGIRAITLRKGDMVKVMKGSKKGMHGKVSKVSTKKGKVSIEGITISKADNKQVSLWLNASNLLITRLDMSDKKRVEKLKTVAALKKIEFVEEAPEPEPETAEKAEEVEKGDLGE